METGVAASPVEHGHLEVIEVLFPTAFCGLPSTELLSSRVFSTIRGT
jgi:hypothetical protein